VTKTKLNILEQGRLPALPWCDGRDQSEEHPGLSDSFSRRYLCSV